jgi:hypothetical protein
MTLKTAAFLAFLGSILATVLLVVGLFFDLLNTVRGLIPAIKLFSSAIYAFAALTVAIFFLTFQRSQK